jgi:hypothetical protein
MIFDVYEHPSFEATYEDRQASQKVAKGLGVGVLSTLVAAAAFWRYYWTDSSPLSSSLVPIVD